MFERIVRCLCGYANSPKPHAEAADGEARVEGPAWPDAREHLDAAVVSTQELLDNEPLWVHRRVEKVEFLDKDRIRRQMSVDFTLPRLGEARPIYYVPISVVKKRVLGNLDVRDASGAALPVLTRAQNAPVAAELLIAVSKARLRTETLDPLLESDLRTIAGDVPESPDAERLLREALARIEDGATADHRKVRADEDYAWPWIGELHTQFILFVETTLEPGTRHVFKFSYEYALRERQGGWIRRAASAPARRARDVLEGFGVSAYHAQVTAPAVVDAESYHAEIVAPPDVFITKAVLRTKPWKADSEGERPWTPRAEHASLGRATLYVSGVPAAEAAEATIDVYFRMRTGGLLLAAWASSVITTTMLLGGGFLRDHGATPRRDALAGLVVALPAAFATYLVPREHPFTRRMFKGLRFLVFATAVIGLGAAASLDIRFGRGQEILWGHVALHPASIWSWLGRISLAFSVVISLIYLFSWVTQGKTMRKDTAPSD